MKTTLARGMFVLFLMISGLVLTQVSVRAHFGTPDAVPRAPLRACAFCASFITAATFALPLRSGSVLLCGCGFSDSNGLAPYQSLGCLAMGRREDAPDGAARDTHPLSDLLLGAALNVSQAQCFGLVESEHDFFEVNERHAARLQIRRARGTTDYPRFLRPGHGRKSPRWSLTDAGIYEHMPINEEQQGRC